MLCGMWDLPGPGLEPVSPALAGGFLTIAPPGKSLIIFIYEFSNCEFSYSLKFICNPKSFVATHGHARSQLRSNDARLCLLVSDLKSVFKTYLVPDICVCGCVVLLIKMATKFTMEVLFLFLSPRRL